MFIWRKTDMQLTSKQNESTVPHSRQDVDFVSKALNINQVDKSINNLSANKNTLKSSPNKKSHKYKRAKYLC